MRTQEEAFRMVDGPAGTAVLITYKVEHAGCDVMHCAEAYFMGRQNAPSGIRFRCEENTTMMCLEPEKAVVWYASEWINDQAWEARPETAKLIDHTNIGTLDENEILRILVRLQLRTNALVTFVARNTKAQHIRSCVERAQLLVSSIRIDELPEESQRT